MLVAVAAVTLSVVVARVDLVVAEVGVVSRLAQLLVKPLPVAAVAVAVVTVKLLKILVALVVLEL